MLSFGFKLHTTGVDDHATIYEYKYGPAYLDGNHYSLLIYDYHIKSHLTDHQLSIYDPDYRNIEVVYQISTVSEWQRRALAGHINDIFQAEIRMVTINNIINE
jgi:hypothetical protein